ncbi:MAG: hypothetical protein NC078_07960, partial [Ruminococcus sp.]|nr:hypothetical protein [Ruminococcus sp.]
SRERNEAGDAWLDMNDSDFTFTLTQSDVKNIDTHICFEASNLSVDSVILESAEEAGGGGNRGDGGDEGIESIPLAKPLHIPLNAAYPGDNRYGKWIDSDILKNFDGDIKVTLDVETVNKTENWSTLRIEDSSRKALDISACNMGTDDTDKYVIYNGQSEFSFVVSSDVLKETDSIRLHVYNLWIKSAVIDDYDPAEDEISPDAKIIPLDSEYPGDWQGSKPIMKNELTAFNGDVRITLEIEAVNDDTVHILPCGSDTVDYLVIIPDCVSECSYSDGLYMLGQKNVPDKFTFVITAEEIAKLNDGWGLFFQGENFTAKSAALEKAE